MRARHPRVVVSRARAFPHSSHPSTGRPPTIHVATFRVQVGPAATDRGAAPTDRPTDRPTTIDSSRDSSMCPPPMGERVDALIRREATRHPHRRLRRMDGRYFSIAHYGHVCARASTCADIKNRKYTHVVCTRVYKHTRSQYTNAYCPGRTVGTRPDPRARAARCLHKTPRFRSWLR